MKEPIDLSIDLSIDWLIDKQGGYIDRLIPN